MKVRSGESVGIGGMAPGSLVVASSREVRSQLKSWGSLESGQPAQLGSTRKREPALEALV